MHTNCVIPGFCLFVCVEVLRPSQLPINTVPGQT